MGGAVGLKIKKREYSGNSSITEPAFVQWVLISVVLGFLFIFLLMPILIVLIGALSKGVGVYLQALTEPVALSAIRLTLLVAAISVPCNLLFGLAASWSIAKFDFWHCGILGNCKV